MPDSHPLRVTGGIQEEGTTTQAKVCLAAAWMGDRVRPANT